MRLSQWSGSDAERAGERLDLPLLRRLLEVPVDAVHDRDRRMAEVQADPGERSAVTFCGSVLSVSSAASRGRSFATTALGGTPMCRVRWRGCTIPRVQLIPKMLIVGLFTPPPGVPGTPPLTADKLNRIWSEVAPTYGYRQLQALPDDAGAVFVGSQADAGVTIQPPLLQVRDPITMTAAQSAERAESVLKIAARHLGATQFFNLGIRHVYNVPIPDNDATGYVMRRILAKSEDDLGELQVGGRLWAGVKYVASTEQVQYTLVIEPLQADNSYLFLDLDAQFPGPTTLDAVTDRASDAEGYITHAVNAYLDRVGG